MASSFFSPEVVRALLCWVFSAMRLGLRGDEEGRNILIANGGELQPANVLAASGFLIIGIHE